MDTELRSRKGRWLSAEAATGLLITVGAFALAALVYTVGDIDHLFHPHREYKAYFDDVRLIKADSAITVAGVKVGHVHAIKPPGQSGRAGMAEVVIKLPPEIKVFRDAVLRIRQDGLLGDRYLELLPGTAGAVLLENDEITNTAFEPTLADIGKQIDELKPKIAKTIDDLSATIAKVRETLEGGAMTDVVEGIDGTIDQIKTSLDEIKGPVLSAVKNADETIAGVRRIVVENEDRIKGSIGNAEKVVADLSGRLDEIQVRINAILDRTNNLIESNHGNVYLAIQNLEETTFYMKEFARKLNENPAVLVFGTDDETKKERERDETEFRKAGRLPPYKREP